ncbi:MAG: hypothetical protein CO143_02530 [Candidatus Moranbacteria bacterium CG_4_9_14_3_um_filter_45_14]|nr:MAG: hypothetical protein CO143_02530 [Candidatus Moranbacteria bacterium CG_4_9_14_3_um_filter_45_14]
MKSPFFYQNQFSQSVNNHKKMLDVAYSRQASSVVRNAPQMIPPQSVRLTDISKKRGLDGIHTEKRAFLKQLQKRSPKDVLWLFFRRGELYIRFIKRTINRLTPSIAPHKMLYGSLIGGVAFGIVSMGFIEHFFGPGVFVRASDSQSVMTVGTVMGVATVGENIDTTQEASTSGSDIFFEYFNEAADEKYKENVREMVKGYPIEAMLPYIFGQDRLTVAFLIGIAKKESNWGKRVPVLDGQDCFNYWGYRGVRRMMGTGGHTCFNSRQDAVETVAKRLNTLIHSEALNTPEKMIVWKCGFSCSGHSRESVKKWISDVDMYFGQAGGDE